MIIFIKAGMIIIGSPCKKCFDLWFNSNYAVNNLEFLIDKTHMVIFS